VWLLLAGGLILIASGLYWIFDRKNAEIEEMRFQIKKISSRNLSLALENKKLKEHLSKMEFVFNDTQTKFTLRK